MQKQAIISTLGIAAVSGGTQLHQKAALILVVSLMITSRCVSDKSFILSKVSTTKGGWKQYFIKRNDMGVN